MVIDEVKCGRCGVRLRIGQGQPEAMLIRRANSENGYCLNCLVTKFFRTSEIAFAIQGNESAFPEALRLTHIQQQFAAVLKAGLSDARPDEIDWDEVIANWPLPFPASDHQVGKSLW